MHKFIFVAFLLLFSFIAVPTCAQTISGSIGTIKRGGSARGKIVLTIPSGLHVNSNKPKSEFAIPTRVSVSARGARVSAVSYPRGNLRRFGFSESPISVYEGKVSFPFKVSIPKSFRGNILRIRALVRFQACTNEVCYPPKTTEVTLSSRVL
jgi:DsbC/DsbD-like thiol-disulfide interchange protein